MSNKLLLKRFGSYILFIILLVGVVNAFSISSAEESLAICPGTTALIAVTVTGEGQYTVGLGGSASKWATSVPLGFVLSEGKSKTVYVYVTPITTALSGSYDLDITITNGEETQTLSKTIVILDCFKVDVDPTESQNICPGADIKYDFNIKNTGSFRETFSIEVNGVAADWITLSENKLDLSAEETKTVFAYAKVPLSIRGIYEFSLSAKGDTTGSVSTSVTSVNVESCYDYNIETTKDYYEICDHTTEIIPITIRNNGNSLNTYDLDLDGPSWADLEKKSITIGPGNSDIVNLLISPDYDTTGDFTFTVTVDDNNGEVRITKILNAKVRDCHGITIDLPDSDGLCAALTKSYKATLTNAGEFTEKFNLYINGASWVKIDKLLVELGPGQSEDVSLEINPGTDDAGNYNIEFIAQSLDKGIKGSDIIQIQVVSQQNCYSPNIEIQKDMIEVSSESSATIPVVLENKGTETATYVIGVSGTASGFVQLNPATIELKPNTAETTYLYVAPTYETGLGKYDLTITASLEDSPILDTDNVLINIIEYVSPVEVGEEAPDETEETGLLNRIWGKIVTFFFGEETEEIEEEAAFEELDQEIEELEEEVTIEEINKIEETFEEETAEESGEISEEIAKGTEEEQVEEELITEEIKEKIIGLETESEKSIVARSYDYAKANRNKVLIGLIVLLLVLLVVRYRKEIIDFFEEDEDDFEGDLNEELDTEEEITEEEPEVETKKEVKKKPKKTKKTKRDI